MEKICKVCKRTFESDKPGLLCRECINEKSRNDYANKKIEKECKYCGKTFFGTRHSLLCEDCNTTRILKPNQVERKVCCPRCGIIMGTKIIKVNFMPDLVIKGTHMCSSCKEKSMKNISERMRSDENPSIKINGRKRNKNEGKTRDEILKESSERMKKYNPMKNPETVQKVKDTYAQKAKSGQIKVKRGREHKNWKGNRDRAQSIRSRLYVPWVFPILEKYNFRCCICGVGGRIEVHHEEEPFRDILKKFLSDRILDDLSYDDFEILIDEIVKYHVDHVVGKPYCVEHHREVDTRRR